MLLKIKQNNYRHGLNLIHAEESNLTNQSTMKKYLLLGLLICLSILPMLGQDQPQTPGSKQIDRNNLALRPNSRDYTIIRKGNNHQRVIQMRSQAMIRHRQAMMNRKMAMERRRSATRNKMIKQQQIRQRMIRQRGMHR